MFLFRTVFGGAPASETNKPQSHPQSHEAISASGTIASTKQKVVTVDDDEAGFARVEFQPLTYAEVATLSESPAEVDRARNRTFSLSLSDVYGPEEDPLEASYNDETYASTGGLHESVTRTPGPASALSPNVVSEFEYGERARRFSDIEDSASPRRWRVSRRDSTRRNSHSTSTTATTTTRVNSLPVGRLAHA